MILDVKNECMSAEDKKIFQGERLVKVVKYVYDNLPYYRQKMNDIKLQPTDIKGLDDLYKLPFTTKKDLRANYPYGALAQPLSNIVRLHASSGTSGKLTVAGYTKNDIEMWSICMARCLAMAGLDSESIIHVAFGYGLFTGGLGLHYGAEYLGATVVPASAGTTVRQLSLMQDFGATALCCTPSYALYLADEIDSLGFKIEDFKLKVGIFGAEPWTNAMRDEIEARLHIKAYDIYGLSEVCGPGIAMECPEKNGMHINDDHFLAEVLNRDDLTPMPDGQEGELVFTTLTKEGMPLIRYRTRDITSINATKCSCGRTSTKINRIVGRNDDMMIIRGVNVFPSQIETAIIESRCKSQPHYFITIDRINKIDTLEIQVEMTDELSVATKEEIEYNSKILGNDIRNAIGVSATIKLVPPHSLQRSEGKAVRVKDKRNLV